MDKITLDREVFKALASDTRLDILKALDVRQKTVTELAKELDLNKATVFEHLEKLQAVNLIQKLEDERKWVYWQLSWTGRRLLHPEQITVALLLSTAAGALLAGAAAIWLWLQSGIAAPAQEDMAAPSLMAKAAEAPAPPALDPTFLAVAIAFGIVAIAAIAWATRVHLKAREKLASATA